MTRHAFRSREAAEGASQVVGGEVFQVAHFIGCYFSWLAAKEPRNGEIQSLSVHNKTLLERPVGNA